MEQGRQGLLGGDAFPANGHTGLRHDFAIRPDLAEADLGIEYIIESGLAREIADRVGQRHVVHDDEWNQITQFGGGAGFSHVRGRGGSFGRWRGGGRGGRLSRILGFDGRCVGLTGGSGGLGKPGLAASDDSSESKREKYAFHVYALEPTMPIRFAAKLGFFARLSLLSVTGMIPIVSLLAGNHTGMEPMLTGR